MEGLRTVWVGPGDKVSDAAVEPVTIWQLRFSFEPLCCRSSDRTSMTVPVESVEGFGRSAQVTRGAPGGGDGAGDPILGVNRHQVGRDACVHARWP
jgi:hypothetical protein